MSSSGDSAQDVPTNNGYAGSGGVENPNKADVLCGRGGNINTHPGNENFRKLIEEHKRVYLTARFKKEKRIITDSIIEEVRRRGGKFLIRDGKTNLWHQVPIEKARDKTSQALRENAPKIRDQIEKENEKVREAMRKEEEAANARGSQMEMDYYSYSSPGSHHHHHHHGSSGPYHTTPDKSPYHESPASHSGYYSTPEKQHYHTGWTNHSPYEYNRHSHSYTSPPQESDPRANEKTPTYSNTKSFMETAVETVTEVFVCPTSLEGIYSKSQPYAQLQSHYPRIKQESPSPGQYSGNKRTYCSPPRTNSYQRRDDHDQWRYQNNYNYSNAPVYHELPPERNSEHSSSPSSQHRHTKRKKWHQNSPSILSQAPKPERATSSSSITGMWNPFPFASPWSKGPNNPPAPLLSGSGTMEEGQEVQLIPRLQSMTVECDEVGSSQPNSNSNSNEGGNDKPYSSDREGTEVRTPPPPDEEPKSSDSGLELDAGGCHLFLSAWFGDDDNDDNNNNDNKTNSNIKDSNIRDSNNQTEDGKVSPTPSIDMNASLASLEGSTTENNSTADLNGASLVNVFSDGVTTVSTGDKSKPDGKHSSDQSFIFGESLLAGDMLSY